MVPVTMHSAPPARKLPGTVIVGVRQGIDKRGSGNAKRTPDLVQEGSNLFLVEPELGSLHLGRSQC